MRQPHFSYFPSSDQPSSGCPGLVQISRPHPRLLGRLYQQHLGQSASLASGFAYAKVLDHLALFRSFFLKRGVKDEPIFVWFSHPKSHTKINPSHLIARGFSPLHLLFLESEQVCRSLPALMQEHRRVSAIILDGFTPDRVLLQLARQWIHTPLGQAWVKADELARFRNSKPERLFLIHTPSTRTSV